MPSDPWWWIEATPGWRRAVEECEFAAMLQDFVDDGRVWVFKPEPFTTPSNPDTDVRP